MFVSSSRLDYQVTLGVEFIHAGQALSDEQIAGIGSFDVVSEYVLRSFTS